MIVALAAMALVVPAGAYHIDGNEIAATGLTTADFDGVVAGGAVVCESNGLWDNRNTQNPRSGTNGLCTSGQNDASGAVEPAGMPGVGAGEWVRMDICTATTMERMLEAPGSGRDPAVDPDPYGLAMNDCTTGGGNTNDHAWTAEIGIFSCDIPRAGQIGGNTDFALYYRDLYGWWSFDVGLGFPPYAVDDASGDWHNEGIAANIRNNPDAYRGHVTAFLQAADSFGFGTPGGVDQQGSAEVTSGVNIGGLFLSDVPVAGNDFISNNCGGSPSNPPFGLPGPVVRAFDP